jgi:hypothetical protein
MGILSGLNPVSAIVDSVSGAVQGVGKVFFGSTEERDQQASDEIKSVQAGYQAEFMAPEKKGKFNQFVDGANRLVRPFFTFGVVALFAWCVYDPAQFSVAMQALRLMPDNLWYVLFAIITFWFGSRTLIDHAAAKAQITGPTEQQVSDVLNSQRQLQELRAAAQQDKYASKIKDGASTVNTTDNPSIQDWINKFKGL